MVHGYREEGYVNHDIYTEVDLTHIYVHLGFETDFMIIEMTDMTDYREERNR